MGFLPQTSKLPDGTESPDQYDLLKSTKHFCVYEGVEDDNVAVGTIRLINKDSPDATLPVEEHFPEFVGKAPMGAIEVSRFVVAQ